MELRPYQKKSIEQINNYFSSEGSGHLCVVMPTGSGKSHVIAEYCKDVIDRAPSAKILMLTHVKELIEQNVKKIREAMPGFPISIYSTGLGSRDISQITFAGIQSIRHSASDLGEVSLVIVDECHLISHHRHGMYRSLIDELTKMNGNLRVLGFTATPYRLNHGLISHGSAIFNHIIEPVDIHSLIADGYLAPLKSKHTEIHYDLSAVKKRGGEFIESQLQKAVNKTNKNFKVVKEVIARAEERKSWLFFCTGVDHAKNVSDILNKYGIKSECVTGKTPQNKRDQYLNDFKSGKIRAITNANVLTTGFDYPDIDLLVMMRPTLSPSLYVQMVGRGMRKKSHTDHCLVLDFAGVVETHGPITSVKIPKTKSSKNFEAPVKICENCHEIVALSCRKCPECDNEFPPPKPKRLELRHDDIMGRVGESKNHTMKINYWIWSVKNTYKDKIPMMVCEYYYDLAQKPIKEFFTICHDGWAKSDAIRRLSKIINAVNRDDFCLERPDISVLIQQLVGDDRLNNMHALCARLNDVPPPTKIHYSLSGIYKKIISREWHETSKTKSPN